MTDKLLELAERCEAATEPDRELDCAISLALVEPPEGCRVVVSELSSQAGLIVDRVGRIHGTVDYQPFTASLDAAMTLVPEGWRFIIDSDGCHCRMTHNSRAGREVTGFAGSMALALCIAALRAKAAK